MNPGLTFTRSEVQIDRLARTHSDRTGAQMTDLANVAMDGGFRTALFAALTLTLLLLGQLVGVYATHLNAAMWVTVVGAFGIAVYLVAGQYKAARIPIPFDGFSWVGLVAAIIFDIGAGWVLWQRRPWHQR